MTSQEIRTRFLTFFHKRQHAILDSASLITNDDPTNYDRWLIQNNQKRKFVDLAVYYGQEYVLDILVTLTDSQIKSIPDGEPIG